ncbi:MAG TPA: hypothetical protein VFV57_06065 [Limnobacter sp.]|nr:hypothetical protein [Limnobacter sp.]
MSRSGYVDDIEDNWRHICWRGAVNSAIKGKRGQAFLKELIAALDAMPKKALIGNSLVTSSGEYCTLGVLGASRGIDLEKIDPEDWEQVANAFSIAPAMVREIVFENDEVFNDWEWVYGEICGPMPTRWGQQHNTSVRVYKENAAELRWAHMRKWAESQLNKEQP